MDRRDFLKTAAAIAAAACGKAPEPEGCAAAPAACPAPGLPAASYFEQLGQDLTDAGYGSPQIVIDLDRLDANADAIAAGAVPSRYRIVEKSLPSLDLLEHISQRTGSERFLVLHLPFLPALLARFPNAHVLIGKPHPIGAVRKLLADVPDAATRVIFLADTKTRLEELASLQLALNVSIEVDVGLHRGGVRTPEQLPDVLKVFDGAPLLKFSGLLGYDGHVSGAPGAPGVEEHAARATFRAAQQRYQAFIDQLGAHRRDGLIFHSGGTSTYPLYPMDGPVNDVATGGGMLRPGAYTSPFVQALAPAIFLGAPVLKQFDKIEIPYVTNLTEGMTDASQGFTVYGGGWPAALIHPAGISYAPFVSDASGTNLVPNEAWLTAPPSLSIKPGDWIFAYPKEGDALFQFEEILLVRGGRLQTQKWRAYPRRY